VPVLELPWVVFWGTPGLKIENGIIDKCWVRCSYHCSVEGWTVGGIRERHCRIINPVERTLFAVSLGGALNQPEGKSEGRWRFGPVIH
jgi:hypothetical protein